MPITVSRRSLVIAAAAATAARAAQAAAPVTPSETEGPFYPRRKPLDTDADLTQIAGRSQRAAGEVIDIRARILDASGNPVNGAQIELWQCNAAGRYAHPADRSGNPLDPNFQGYAHLGTGPDGWIRAVTIRPAPYKVPENGQVRTPHIHFRIAGRRTRLSTQMYFPGEPLNETDFLIRAMKSDPGALVARAGADGEGGMKTYIWDVVLARG
jgi:protocatechuate 3,4-dioxygenase beta subunit